MSSSEKYCYDYPRPAVATDCVVFCKNGKDIKVLLIQRGRLPYKGKWAFPGGFLEMDEDAETCAKRELEEETSIKDIELEQLHTFTKVDRDPRGRMLSIVYWGIVNGNIPETKGGDDAEKAEWFSIYDLPGLAFDHEEIIKMALDKLKTQYPEYFVGN